MSTSLESESFAIEAEGCGDFSSKLYKFSAGEMTKGNVISSPISVHIILSYLCHGADGETASEMINGLSIKDIKQLHIGYKSLISTLNSVKEAELSLANAVFLHDNIQLFEAFSALGKDFYNFTAPPINFGDSIESAKIINEWVMNNTRNKIVDIITSDDITEDTRAILINAIYFKGPWKYPFNGEYTVNKIFHVTKDIQKQVPTMKNKHRYSYGELSALKSKFIEIPYADENVSMVVILPDDTSNLSYLEENFNWKAIVEAKTKNREIVLYLPKFKIECTLNLKEPLYKLGIKSIFENSADFSNMTGSSVKVSKIIQKAFIEVNEQGSEAAAATVVQIRLKRALDLPDEFIVDRPFMIIIRHIPSNIPLFIGSVRDIGTFVEKDEL